MRISKRLNVNGGITARITDILNVDFSIRGNPPVSILTLLPSFDTHITQRQKISGAAFLTLKKTPSYAGGTGKLIFLQRVTKFPLQYDIIFLSLTA